MDEAPPTQTPQPVDWSLHNMSAVAPTYVVGIGASAGGVEALRDFFRNMPTDTGMAFVIVQHISPDYKSLMDQILQRDTAMPIERVEDHVAMTADTIYLIPSGVDMVVSHGYLRLEQAHISRRGIHLPINTFLQSLAEDYADRAIGIILSGTGSDGAIGIRAIKEAEGLVLVQSPETSQFDGMPQSAIQTGDIDVICAPDMMPQTLCKLVADASPAEKAGPEMHELSIKQEEEVRAVFQLLQQACEIDFTQYKRTTVYRRLYRRMSLASVPDLKTYLSILHDSSQERMQLCDDLLIGVTRFFRDPEVFNFLEHEIMPQLVAHAASTNSLRVWAAGCSTGEEAYSLAILLHEAVRHLTPPPDIKVFATDVSKSAMEYAAMGRYPKHIATDVNPECLQWFFTDDGEMYQVTRALRQSVVFASHNLLVDPPFSRIDLVACRNLLIYLEPEPQQSVLTRLLFALRHEGFLVLGSSESVGNLSAACRPVGERWKVFQKGQFTNLPLQTRMAMTRTWAKAPSASHTPTMPQPSHPHSPLSWSTYESLTEGYCPPVLVVDAKRQLALVLGSANAYFRPRSGPHTADIAKIIHTDLAGALIVCFHKVTTSQEEVIYADVPVDMDSETRHVTIRARPIFDRAYDQPLVAFYLESSANAETVLWNHDITETSMTAVQRMADLEQALHDTQEHLQATLEEANSSNEELQAINEELVASNEELQSTNEELQSVNEELHTVNMEHQIKFTELVQVTNDVENLLQVLEVGTVFLDEHLHVRRFTPRVTRLLNLLPQDLGRPFHHVIAVFAHKGLHDMLLHTLASGESLTEKVCTDQGVWFQMQILPYYTETKTIAGVVLIFTDILSQQQVEAAPKQEE